MRSSRMCGPDSIQPAPRSKSLHLLDKTVGAVLKNMVNNSTARSRHADCRLAHENACESNRWICRNKRRLPKTPSRTPRSIHSLTWRTQFIRRSQARVKLVARWRGFLWLLPLLFTKKRRITDASWLEALPKRNRGSVADRDFGRFIWLETASG